MGPIRISEAHSRSEMTHLKSERAHYRLEIIFSFWTHLQFYNGHSVASVVMGCLPTKFPERITFEPSLLRAQYVFRLQGLKPVGHSANRGPQGLIINLMTQSRPGTLLSP